MKQNIEETRNTKKSVDIIKEALDTALGELTKLQTKVAELEKGTIL